MNVQIDRCVFAMVLETLQEGSGAIDLQKRRNIGVVNPIDQGRKPGWK